MGLRSLLLAPLQAIVPSACAGCGIPGAACCADCEASLTPVPGPVCDGCGHPFAVEVARCARCRGRVCGARAAVLYDGAAPGLVAALKDRGRPALATMCADRVSQLTPQPTVDAALVPIPLSASRLRRRGFNQSELIAIGLGRAWGRHVERDLLLRTGGDQPQRGASESRRDEQVRGVFALAPGRAPPRAVCLVDDVHTTGATLAAAAQALWLGGTRTITARCFARSVRRG